MRIRGVVVAVSILVGTIGSVSSAPETIAPGKEAFYQFDMRQVRWGMSREQVAASETIKPEPSAPGGPQNMAFKDKLLGEEAMIVYSFAGEHLARAVIMFLGEHSNKNLYLDDYRSVSAMIENKYRKATSDDQIWKNDLYKNNPDELGMAVSAGHLVLQSEWRLPETTIFHKLFGDNFIIRHGLTYTSTEYGDVLDGDDARAESSKF